MNTSPNMLTWALAYAQQIGWYVFPVHIPRFDRGGQCIGCTCEQYRWSADCKRDHPRLYLASGERCANPGKCPKVRWAEKSTIDPVQIRKWWGYWPTANIGIDCGKSNLLVFDADTYKQVGDLSDLLTWADRQTITSITGGGGEHLIYDRQNKPYSNATGKLPPGIDIRGAGGYIVAPPSLHKSGRRYLYEDDYRPSIVKPLPIPDALDALLSQVTKNYGDQASEPNEPAIKRAVVTVKMILQRASLTTFGMEDYGAGRRWVLQHCPFNPADDQHAEDRSAFIVVRQDGKIAAGCHHNRCQQLIKAAESGWQLLRKLTGQERRRVIVEVEA